MSNTYGFGGSGGAGGSLSDLISALKGVVQNGGGATQSIQNVWPAPTSSPSPVFIGVNSLGTTGTTVMTATTGLAGLIIQNVGTATAYVYSLSMATTPTLTAPGGALEVLPGAWAPFPAVFFANFNIGLGAFVSTGSAGALTIVQFF